MTTDFSYLGNADTDTLEEMYLQYQRDPNALEYGWRKFFEGFDFGRTSFDGEERIETASVPENVRKEFNVINLINLYRASGHLFTKTNPVRERRKYHPTLDQIDIIGLSEAD